MPAELYREGVFALFILSLGLAMDAVAVSLVRGSTGGHRPLRALETGAAFGVAQGLMPLVGWSLGAVFAGRIAAFDHWIAFALLSVLGARMVLEAVRSADEGPDLARGRSHYAGLAVAALATSIDAAAAGITLPLLGEPLALACLMIGGVTAALCAAAHWAGRGAARGSGKLAEVVGGVVLIALGAKILIEHLSA